MLVVPLVSKSSVLVIRLSQQGEVCTSGISQPFSKSKPTVLIAFSISSPLRNWVRFSQKRHYSVLSAIPVFLDLSVNEELHLH